MSQLVDTVVINFVAWFGVLSLPDVFNIITSSYVLKILIAVGLTPLIYAGHALIERVLALPPARATDQSSTGLDSAINAEPR